MSALTRPSTSAARWDRTRWTNAPGRLRLDLAGRASALFLCIVLSIRTNSTGCRTMMAEGLSRILGVVAAHPWLDVEQASALTGLSRRQTARLLEQAVGERLAQVCHVAGLCTYGALYALTRRGMRGRSAASPIGLERTLLQIEPLWGARNLLAGLAQ